MGNAPPKFPPEATAIPRAIPPASEPPRGVSKPPLRITPPSPPVESGSIPPPDSLSTTEWFDSRPHGAKHVVNVFDLAKDPTQMIRFLASCSCGFQARCRSLITITTPQGGMLYGIDYYVNQHKVNNGG